jgi:hypothetical protein
MSTVATLVIPPFLAAERIDASAPKAKTRRNVIPDFVPTLLPIGLEETATGIVMLQEVADSAKAAAQRIVTIFFIINEGLNRCNDKET